ncbi:MAG TPA: hypothetical protein VGK42_03495 [Candidatus Dormibacteraeota bacterium]
MQSLSAELRIAWRRTWGGRLMPVLLLAAVLLLVAVRLWGSTPAGAVHRELAQLESANEIIAWVLVVLALVSAYKLVAPDLRDEFEPLSTRGQSRPVTFAAGRAIVGAGGLLIATAALGLAVEVLNLGGRYEREEALRAFVLFLNAVPLFMLATILTCAFGRIVGLIAPVVIQAIGAEAAYQRGAMADSFIDPSGLYSFEQLLAWLAPRPLMDPLLGTILMDQSAALEQFPVRQGHSVWGWDLIQVSGPGDVAMYGVYLVALVALLLLVCRLRTAYARTRFQTVGDWLGAGKADRDAG